MKIIFLPVSISTRFCHFASFKMKLRISTISRNAKSVTSNFSAKNSSPSLIRQQRNSSSGPSSTSSHNSTTTSSTSRPFFKLSNVRLSTEPSSGATQKPITSSDSSRDAEIEINWVIEDLGEHQCWAIVGPASEKAAMVKKELVRLLGGQTRPRTNASTTQSQHPPAHPFLSHTSTHPSQVIQHVSFGTRLSNSNSTSTGFQDYSVRYGAIREDEDKVTLFESLMNNLGCKVGNIAKKALVPDPLSEKLPASFLNSTNDSSSSSSRFKWESKEHFEKEREKALIIKEKVLNVGRMLDLGSELMNRPLIALSNGQTRRARISNALLSSGVKDCQALILTEPYTGLDPKTRKSISSLLERLHSEKNPRVVLVLREQDEIPKFITDVLGIEEDGKIGFLGKRDEWDEKVKNRIRGASSNVESREAQDLPKVGMEGGVERVQKNRELGIGRGDESQQPIVNIKSLTIKYGDKAVLDNIDFVLPPGSSLILAGANGSGKTTLLSLILGDHPRSYSFPASTLSLFGDKRSAPINSTANLLRKVGHLSPELFNSFPRKSLEYGGMDVEDCIGSGFEGVFCRRRLDENQKKRIRGLVEIFKDLITSSGDSKRRKEKDHQGEEIQRILNTAFFSLSAGSQAIVLFLRSIVHSPELLVLDEPFQGMDSKQVSRVRAYLDSRHLTENISEFSVGETEEEKLEDERNRREMSLVLVSHYEQEYPVSAGRLVRLDEGKVVELI